MNTEHTLNTIWNLLRNVEYLVLKEGKLIGCNKGTFGLTKDVIICYIK